MRTLRWLAALGLLGAGTLHAAPSIPLQENVPQSFTLPANSFTTSYYVDVGPSANILTITVDGLQPAGADIDLLLRYGSPFPDTLDGVRPPDANYLTELAQYRAISPGGLTERISIDKSGVFPVREGRWYIALISFEPGATAQVKAVTSDLLTPLVPFEIVFDDPDSQCDTAPWNDASPRAAVGGNNGTTLGQQRRNAVLEAARLLSLQLRSTTPVRVRACWGNLFVSGNSATLAQAGARANTLDAVFPTPKFLPRGQTSYTITVASKLAGTDFCGIYPYVDPFTGDLYCDHGEIKATFNTLIDGPTGLGATSFYYGFNQQGGTNVDFIAVAMHEITHGLGFTGEVSLFDDPEDPCGGPPGTKVRLCYDGTDSRYVSYDDIYGSNMVYAPGDGTAKRYMEISDTERVTAVTSNGGLRWDDPLAVNANGNFIFSSEAPPNNYVRLNSPNPIQPGSSQSHLSTAYGAGELMTPSIVTNPHTLGLAAPMLRAMGWSNDPRTPKNTAPQFSGVYYDPAHPGHGIGFTRIVGDVYFLAFYTYDDTGAPEWYIAIGSVVDGIFVPAPNANGDSLVRYKYNANGNPKQVADPSIHGNVRMDFNDAKYAQACSQSPHNTGGPLALMTFTISTNPADLTAFDKPKELRWCMQPIIPPGAAGAPDYSGTWNAGSGDSGWGYSLASFGSGQSAGLFAVLYYPDANGDGRWAYLSGAGPSGTDYDLVERHGYCRACPVPDSIKQGQYDDRVAGTIKLTLNGTVQGQSNGQSIFDLTYKLPPNGQFKRPDSQMVLLSVPGGQ